MAPNNREFSAFELKSLLLDEYPATEFVAPIVLIIPSRHGLHRKHRSLVACVYDAGVT
jgi:hypothetical protein